MAYYISMIIGQSILDLTGLDFNWLMVLLALIAFSPLLVDFSGYLFRLLEQLFNKYKKNKIKL